MFFEITKSILLIVTALFPIVNPIGGSPVFLLLTQDYSTESRRLLARRVAMNSFILLIVSVVVGTHILSFFGISLPVVQVGGGLVVVSTGWAMLTRSDQMERGASPSPCYSTGHFKECFLSADLAADSGARIDFHRHHAGRQ